MPFSYKSSDGRRKASLEDAMTKGKNRSVLMNQQPWQVGWQVSERNLLWNNHVAAGLVKVISFMPAYKVSQALTHLTSPFLRTIVVISGLRIIFQLSFDHIQ